MDPIELVWEVGKALFALVSAVAIPLAALWLIARQQRNRRGRNRPR